MTASTEPTPAHAAPWRVVTWNIRGAARPDLGRIAEVIGEYSPDVVVLQEVRSSQARRIAGVLGWRNRWGRKHYPLSPLVWWRAEGLAIMSPHALYQFEVHSISPGISSWSFRHRVILGATVERAGDQIRVYGTHLAAHQSPDERIAQAIRATALVRHDAAAAFLVAGDLNAPDDETLVVREFATIGLRDAGGGPTIPAIAPRTRLDYVLIPDRGVVTEQHEPGGGEAWWELSDHLPVLVAFSLPVD